MTKENRELLFFPTAEGYVNITKISGGQIVGDYVYNYTDHLGNIRLSYFKDFSTGQLKVLEENHYYPFGLKHQTYSAPSYSIKPAPSISFGRTAIQKTPTIDPEVDDDVYNYQYNGKEFQGELGLNVYDYGWRDYDPATARFNKMDRFSEKYHYKSPYNYAANNPIRYIDEKGDSIWVTGGWNKDTKSYDYTIHFTGKLLNISDGNDKAYWESTLASNISSKLKKGIEGASGEHGGVQYNFKADINFSNAESIDDVSSSDHLLVITDYVFSNGEAVDGVAKFGGMIAYVDDTASRGIVSTAVHEIGHLMGLEHSWKDGLSDTNSGNNYMSYDTQQSWFSNQQVYRVLNMASGNSSLNIGSPTQKAPNSESYIFPHRSSSHHPWDGNVKQGDIIPTIIPKN